MKLVISFIQSFSHSILQFFRNEYKRYKGRPKALLNAIEKAQKLTNKTGKRYKVYFLQNRYQILTRSDVQQKRRHGAEFQERINVTKLRGIAFFDTHTGFVSDFAYDLLKTKYSGMRLIKMGIVKSSKA